MPKKHLKETSVKIATPVNLIILDPNKRVLLVRRAESEDQFKHCWSIPGGGPKQGETYEEALHREIKEELNCAITNATYFKSYYYKVSPTLEARAAYFYGSIKGTIKLSKEHTEFKWFDFKEIDKLTIAFNQKEILTDFNKHIRR